MSAARSERFCRAMAEMSVSSSTALRALVRCRLHWKNRSSSSSITIDSDSAPPTPERPPPSPVETICGLRLSAAK